MNFPQPGPSPGPSLAIAARARRRKPSILLCAKAHQAETVGNGPERTFQVWQESGPLVWQEMGYCLSQWPAGIPQDLLGRRKRPCVSFFSLCPLSLSLGGARGLRMLHVAGACTVVPALVGVAVFARTVSSSRVFALCVSPPALGRAVVCCSGWVGLFWDGWVAAWAAEGKSLPFTESPNGLGSVRRNL